MITVTLGDFQLTCATGPLPELNDHYIAHARLVERFHDVRRPGPVCFVAVGRAGGSPLLVVILEMPHFASSLPGVLLVPETGLLFVGVGDQLLAYRLEPPARLWEDAADHGFWGWRRHGDVVLMSGELELAAWSTEGRKLWTTSVEPPWDYEVHDGVVRLDVMGVRSEFPLRTGPALPG